jgi:hypothetical protein
MVFMLPQICIIICNAILQMPFQEERNLLMVVFYAPGGLYGPAASPSVPNPPNKKATKKDKPSSSHHKDG